MLTMQRTLLYNYTAEHMQGRVFALFGQALPPFWLGIMLILIFSVQFNLLPTSQRGGIEHYILPSVTLGWLVASGFLRLIRSSMLEVLDSEFIKFARAKVVSIQKSIQHQSILMGRIFL